MDMSLKGDDKATVTLPDGATHCFINLIDENSFLVVYPKIDVPRLKDEGKPMSAVAISVMGQSGEHPL